MKKIIAVCLLLLTFFSCSTVFAAAFNATGKKDYEMINAEGYEGYWAEKSEGKLIMSVTPSDEAGWYDVTIANRDKLPKMDVYIMRAHYQDKDGSLYYENCMYVKRHVKKNGTVKDKVQYRNGSGLLYYSFDENVLYWTDYTLPKEERVKVFIKTAAPEEMQ